MQGFGCVVWGFGGRSVIINAFVKNLRDARHLIGEMITGKSENWRTKVILWAG